MSNLGLDNTMDKKRNLTLRFVVTGLVTTILIVLLITAGGYSLLRSQGLQTVLDRVNYETDDLLAYLESSSNRRLTRPELSPSSVTFYAELGRRMARVEVIDQIAIYDIQRRLRWASHDNFSRAISVEQAIQVSNNPQQNFFFNRMLLDLSGWLEVLIGTHQKVSGSLAFRDDAGTILAIAKVDLNADDELRVARSFGIQLFAFVLLGNLILFGFLYLIFRNGVLTIERQEQRLNQQISRLSSLLAANKSLQKSMKTASARAVELNEQFLRRVGADLHDGPAQMIGYSVLRLNQISNKEEAQALGHEFHAIKEALDESLDEIRGISSGLVLPELESMSLEQCLRKVVALHGAKSNTEVAQYYTNLDQDIALPVKITAYRFVQEGLNNAHRHGQAEKCRISAHVKNGDLHLSLKDNGMGFRMSQLQKRGGHLGLLGLKDRVESLGGKFSINSELGIGTALKLVISLVDGDVE